MNESEFRKYLKRGGRSDSAIKRCVKQVSDYQAYLDENYSGLDIDGSTPEMLESYVSWVESEPKASAKTHLWALRYYFDFIGKDELKLLAGELRQERIQRKPFQIKNFRGVNPVYIAKLDALDIKNINQMLEAGRTAELREELSERTGIPLEAIVEYVKLSDLARLGAVRGVRARLYHDAGLSPETIATWEPAELRAVLVDWVERNNFDGIAPLPKEVQHLVDHARKLSKIVEW